MCDADATKILPRLGFAGSYRENPWGYIRRIPRYKESKGEQSKVTQYDDGTTVSERFIRLKAGEILTPEEILECTDLTQQSGRLLTVLITIGTAT